MSVRVRFAPSPTGFLHVGGARTALFNWLFARHHGGTMVLRIEDTDVARERPEYREAIYQAFEWLGLDFDEGPGKGGAYGPYTQRERLPLYQEKARELAERGLAYPCFCTPKDEASAPSQDDEPEQPASSSARCQCRFLSAEERAERERSLGGEMPALRFAVDQSRAYAVDDLVRGHVIFPAGQVEDFIITKVGLQPLYNFAAVIDDHAMEITHVIRGEEHLANTPKQNLLYEAFGWTPPIYAHIPIILNMEGKKLSKRDGATAVADFRRLGYLPEALLNFIALLGWSPGGDREIMSRDEMIAAFDIARVQKHGAKFDTEKLTWMNGEYIKVAPLEELVEGTSYILSQESDVASLRTDWDHVAAVCQLMRERVKTLGELVRANRYLFTAGSIVPDPEAVRKRAGTPEAFERLALVRERLEGAPSWDPLTLEAAIRALAEEKGGKAGDFIHPLRVAVTGHAVSPGIFETLAVLGREVALRRVAEFLDRREALTA